MNRSLSIFLIALYSLNAFAQSSKVIDVPISGKLSNLLTTSEKATITNLTVTGNIDAQDVKCMRDELPLLTNLDLSNVSIKEYVGNSGTHSSVTTYSANEFPTYAFCTASGISKNSIVSVLLPNTITSIGDLAFYSCSGLVDIIIPNSVTTIKSSAFQTCKGLKTITLSSNLQSLGDQCLYETGLKIIKSLNPVPPTLGGLALGYNFISIVYVPSTSVATYKAANGWSGLPIGIDQLITVNNPNAGGLVSSLSSAGFSQLSSITKLKVTGNLSGSDIDQIKNNMTLLMELDLTGTSIAGNSLPANAFYGKNKITSIKLPSSVVEIGDYAFAACTNLSDLFPLPLSLSTIGSFAFSNCISLKGDLIIPNSVTTIRSYAFNGCSGFNGIISLSENLTSIPTGVFAGCRAISGKLTLPLSVTNVDLSAFYNCQKLSELSIGKNTNTFGDEVFQGCSGLNKISVKRSTPPTILANTFSSVNKSSCTLEVPFGSKVSYQSDNYWKLFTNIIETSDTSKITIKVGIGGKVKENSVILPNDTVIKVISGTTKIFSIEPEDGYEIDSVSYRGSNVKQYLVDNQYTTAAINADATFKVTFKRFYNLNVRIGEGGRVKDNNLTLSDKDVIKLYAGDKKTFTILPNEGFEVDSITYGGQKITLPLIDNQFTTPTISSSGTLNVTFKPTNQTYNISFEIGSGGSVKENNVTKVNGDLLTVPKNGVRTFTFVLDNGYEVDTLFFGGKDVKSQLTNDKKFTTQVIVDNATLKVTFKKVQYFIELKDITSKGAIRLLVNYGDTPSFSFIADNGWEVNTITNNDIPVSANLVNGIYTLPAVTANVTIKASFVSIAGTSQIIRSNVKVYSTQTEIIIDGTSENEIIRVFNLNGNLIQTIKSDGDRLAVPVTRNAIYLVKTAFKTYKVIL